MATPQNRLHIFAFPASRFYLNEEYEKKPETRERNKGQC
jgi:hypothetical protein